LSQQPVDYDADIVGQMGAANGRFFFGLLQIGSHQRLNKPAASSWNVVNQRQFAVPCDPISHCPYIINMNPHYELEFSNN
jgi:hypothetical protein